MDYVFSISVPSLAIILVSAVLVLSCGQTESQNRRGGDRCTHATTVGVSRPKDF